MLDSISSGGTTLIVPSNFEKVNKKGLGELMKDALGFEMIQYVRDNSPPQRQGEQAAAGYAADWLGYFCVALESMVAVAMTAADQVERMCLVSMIYCWFNDRLLKQNKQGTAHTSQIHRCNPYSEANAVARAQNESLASPEVSHLPQPRGYRTLEDLPPHLQGAAASLASEAAKHVGYISTGDEALDVEVYKLWVTARKQQQLEDDVRSQLSLRLAQRDSRAPRRPYSAGAVRPPPRTAALQSRPSSAIMRRLVQQSDGVNADETSGILARPVRAVGGQEAYLRCDSDDDVDRPLSGAVRQLKETPHSTFYSSLIARERPYSARKFQELAAEDSEIKVLYRNTNYRRMPLTLPQIKWLEDQEKTKKIVADELARLKAEAEKVKAQKAKAKSAEPKKGDKKESKGDKSKKEAPAAKKTNGSTKVKKQLPRIAAYIPVFDSDVASANDANGPMRVREIDECDRVEEAFRKLDRSQSFMKDLSLKLRNILITPQDKPVCLAAFNMKGPMDGLRKNPAPEEKWRKFVLPKIKAKGSSKKKK